MTELAPGTRMAEWLEQAWLERYLARQLGEQETDWFEAYMLDKAHMLQHVEQDADLRDALAAQRPSVEAAPSDVAGKSPVVVAAPPAPAARNVTERSFARPLAMAACVVLALLAGWIGNALLGTPGSAEIEAAPTRIVYDTMRGTSSAPRVENAESQSKVVLVEVGLPANAQSAELLVQGRQARALTVSADGFASFLIDRELAKASQEVSVRYQVDGRDNTLPLNLHAALRREPTN